MKRIADYSLLFLVAGLAVILDQWSKHFVRTTLAFSDSWAPWDWMLPLARIVHWNNTGAAFGMFQGLNVVFMILAVIVSIAIIYYYPQVPRQDWLIRLALGLMLGGAIGNLIDRVQFGAVTDFISVGNFAVFNVADSCITVGVILLILGMWLKERKSSPGQAAAADSTPVTSEPDSSPISQETNGQ